MTVCDAGEGAPGIESTYRSSWHLMVNFYFCKRWETVSRSGGWIAAIVSIPNASRRERFRMGAGVGAWLGAEGMVPPWPLQCMPSGTLPRVEGKAMRSVALPQISSLTVQLSVLLDQVSAVGMIPSGHRCGGPSGDGF